MPIGSAIIQVSSSAAKDTAMVSHSRSPITSVTGRFHIIETPKSPAMTLPHPQPVLHHDRAIEAVFAAHRRGLLGRDRAAADGEVGDIGVDEIAGRQADDDEGEDGDRGAGDQRQHEPARDDRSAWRPRRQHRFPQHLVTTACQSRVRGAAVLIVLADQPNTRCRRGYQSLAGARGIVPRVCIFRL